VEITVKDNGIGFEEKYQKQIFQPFKRLHTREKYEGIGMGLAICQKIVAHHGGELTAQSTLGRGSIFFIRLPRADSQERT
jgi:signal transduction histidine kinase